MKAPDLKYQNPPDNADWKVTLETNAPTLYTLSFGSGLRSGEIVSSPPSVDPSMEGPIELTPRDSPHEWVASGPIRFEVVGDSQLRIAINEWGPVSVAPGGRVSTTCPTERRRLLALGAAAGGVAAISAHVWMDDR
jgi:hypothetical protein